MEQLKVPTHPLHTELRYFDERPLFGRIFLPAWAQHHDGPMRPEEWINQTNQFFPFLQDGSKRARILNKRHVVALSIALEDKQKVGIARRVAVECGSMRVDGVVYIDMPEHSSRLLDWINRPELFLVVHDGNRQHIVQKSRITFLSELDE